MLIYLATPYSHDDKFVREWRFTRACRIAGKILEQGLFVFSPIAHSHPIAESYDLPTNWDFWCKYDKHMLSKCDLLLVVQIDGWDASKGIKREIEYAQLIGKPIVYTTIEDLQTTIDTLLSKTWLTIK